MLEVWGIVITIFLELDIEQENPQLFLQVRQENDMFCETQCIEKNVQRFCELVRVNSPGEA